VLQPTSVPNRLAKNSVANRGTIILLIILDLLVV
jgi:hypothetical protein